VSLAGVLFAIEPVITLLLMPLGSLYLVAQWRLARARYETEYVRTTKRRWMRYFASRLLDHQWVPEIKLLGLAPVLLDRCRALLVEFRDQNRRLYAGSLLGDLAFTVLATAALYAALARVAAHVVSGLSTVGDVAIYGGAAVRLRRSLQSGAKSISDAREGLLYISNLRSFFRAEPQVAAGPTTAPPVRHGAIEVRNVSFTYAGSERPALLDVSFRIQPGETIALVGENGAGKTTLARLLARLYDPTEGCILAGDLDLRDLSLAGWHDAVGCVFQNIGQYEATVADNIAYGDWQRLSGDRKEIVEIARLSGVHDMIEAMPQGYDTSLGRTFGDYTPSLGQWQRLAIARAFARRDAALLILDEPTSNMDARAEYELFCRFRELAAGRTVVLISHRFSTVSIADRILVLDGGLIIEQGSHQDLLAQEGHYASLYRLHMRHMSGET
jgi:ATP-binding cassette subfamily B protein